MVPSIESTNMHITPKQQNGFALILTLIISSVALSIGLSLLNITVKQLTLGTTARESEIAFQTAAAGMNCLQYARNSNLIESQSNGQTFSVQCAGQNITMTDGNAAVRQQEYEGETNLVIAGRQRCIEYQMFVLDATAGAINFNPPTGGATKTCANGDVCTYAFSRGHNRACLELSGGGGSFIVQRELTAEF